METVEYYIAINASKEKIWELLWDKEFYAKWSQFFQPLRSLKTDWKIGGKTYFLAEDGDGLVSTISRMEKPDFLTFQHLGLYKNGTEITKGPQIIEWSGIEEKYELRAVNTGETELRVIIHTYKNQRKMMDAGFAKGLQLLKEACEK